MPLLFLRLLRRFEIILIALFIIALFMTFKAWVGGSLLLIIAVGILAVLYFPLAPLLFKHYGNQDSTGVPVSNGVRTVLSLGVGLALSNLSLGILFKIQQWIGAAVLFYFGLALSATMLIILLILFLRRSSPFLSGMAIRLLVFGGFALWLMMVSPLTLVKMAYGDHPRYIDAYEAFLASPENPEVNARLDLEGMRATMSPENFTRFEEYWYEENSTAIHDSLRLE